MTSGRKTPGRHPGVQKMSRPDGAAAQVYTETRRAATAAELRRTLRRARNRLKHHKRAAEQAAADVAIAQADIERIEQQLQAVTP